MINLEEISKYYPHAQGFERNILREYLQYKILDIIFRGEAAGKLSFLGGTAIKICYGSSRFSEDLDFDNFGLTEKEFSGLSRFIEKELSLEGYRAETRTVFKDAFRCYVRIPRLLRDYGLSGNEGEKIMIQVDTAPHGFSYVPDNFLLQKFEVFRNIKVTPPDIILSQKVAAIFGRKRAKGRDFYDVVYLTGKTDFNFGYLGQKFGIKSREQLKRKLLDFTRDFDFKGLARDVLPFLMNPDDRERVLSFREYIEQEL